MTNAGSGPPGPSPAEALVEARRLVVKIGSALLTTESGEVRWTWLDSLAEDVARCRVRNQELILVSSGAIAVGRRQLGLAGRRLILTVSPAAREWLALTGFDPVFGARPLRRLVQSAIGDKLARALLSGSITDGDEVLVDLDPASDELTVTPAAKVA